MHTKIARVRKVAALERVLEALGQELIESTDEELLRAAQDLGMDPKMRGSAAFLGLKYLAVSRPSEYFDVATLQLRQLGAAGTPIVLAVPGKRLRPKKKPKNPPGRGGKVDPE